MGQRREARERAVQFLFQHDLNPPENLEEALGHFWSSQRAPAIAEEKASANWGQKVELPPATAEELATRLFADKLIRGVLEHRAELDKRIRSTPKTGTSTHGGGGSQYFAPGHLRNAAPRRYSARGPSMKRSMSPKNSPPRTAASSSMASSTRSKANSDCAPPAPSNECIRLHRQPQPKPPGEPPPAFADLHLHTLFSDGTFTPEELAGQGRAASAWWPWR
jgi:hypothetical protein